MATYQLSLTMLLSQVFVASEVHTLATLREFVWDSIRVCYCVSTRPADADMI